MRFRNPIVPSVNLGSFLVMLFTTVINFLVMHYEKKKGISLNSDFLVADSMHTRSDIFASASVIFAFIAIKLGFPIVDVIVAIIIAFLIGKSAIDILRSSSQVLCDRAAMDTKIIRGIVLGIDGVLSCHKIRTRGRKDDIYVDLHVQVKPDMHVDRAHQISSKIEEEIKKQVCGVTDVVVHIEPR
jgi:cation diffusion facilitator family transporter